MKVRMNACLKKLRRMVQTGMVVMTINRMNENGLKTEQAVLRMPPQKLSLAPSVMVRGSPMERKGMVVLEPVLET